MTFTTAKQVIEALRVALIRDVEAYIRELNRDSVVSRSHLTLRAMYLSYGVDKVDAEVAHQFAAAKAGDEIDAAEYTIDNNR